MSRFKIGQQVVCVKSHSEGVVKKGITYTIKNNNQPCKCSGTIDVNIKADYSAMFVNCTYCNSVFLDDDVWWINESLFAPLKADMTSKELTLEIEEFELETIEYN